MNSTEVLIAVAYGLVTVAAVVLALMLAVSTRGSRPPVDEQRLAHRERNWLYIVIAILLALLFATIWFTPYGHGGTQTGDVVVRVDSRQFFWRVQPNTFPANREIEFRLTSADVNHGFGIYDPDDRLVAQVQVVPGKTQTLVRKFGKAGHYRILCLEFCGFGHALMQGAFTVTP
jgi:cytochrome c oxidase subunit II